MPRGSDTGVGRSNTQQTWRESGGAIEREHNHLGIWGVGSFLLLLIETRGARSHLYMALLRHTKATATARRRAAHD